MQIDFRKCLIRVLPALVLFVLCLTTAFMVSHRAKLVNAPNLLPVSSSTQSRPASSTEWKEVLIKDKVVIRVPENMKMVEPLGDAPWYREAYRNRDIDLTVSYGYTSIPGAKLPESLTLCDTTNLQRDDPTYSASVATIDGRQAKLHERRGDGFIFTAICFAKTPDNPIPLWVGAYCKDESALSIALDILKSIRFKT